MTKLAVRVLPAVFCFVNGVVEKRLVGFEAFNNRGDFTTREFEFSLAECGVLGADKVPKGLKSMASVFGGARSTKRGSDDESDDD